MNRKTGSRILSLILSVFMLLQSLPVLAETPANDEANVAVSKGKPYYLTDGNFIGFGYESYTVSENSSEPIYVEINRAGDLPYPQR